MKKILVVNNDIDTMSLIKDLLERKDYQVKYTSSHNEVSELVENFKPGIILVDILQKAVISTLKTNRKTSHIPIILMSGYTLKDSVNQIAADAIIEKPFSIDLLEKKMNAIFISSDK